MRGGCLSSEKEEKKVRDVMSSPVVSVLPTDSVFEAASKMMSHGVGAVVIESGGRPEGIVTERDLIRRVLMEGKDPKKVACREIMSKPLVTIDPEASILKAITLMKEKEIRRIVVVKGGRTVGIVTEKELIRNLL
ncbi:MAG: CBS domain-containing protein [Thermoproteota archaeon]|nr:CBS domain-containing protein [Candidatus Brockarchaeota archaeon]